MPLLSYDESYSEIIEINIKKTSFLLEELKCRFLKLKCKFGISVWHINWNFSHLF